MRQVAARLRVRSAARERFEDGGVHRVAQAVVRRLVRRAPAAVTPVRQSRARAPRPAASCPLWRPRGGTPRKRSRFARPSSARWSTSVSCRCRRWWRSPGTRPTEGGARAHAVAPCGACQPPARWWRRPVRPPAWRRRRGRCRSAGRWTSQRRSSAATAATTPAMPIVSHTSRPPSASSRRSSGVGSSSIALTKRADPSELGPRTSGDDNGQRGAARRPWCRGTPCCCGRRRGVRRQRRDLLFSRQRLAGERRFVGVEIGRRQQPDVGRHTVAGVELDDVAGNNRLGRSGDEPSVALHQRMRRLEMQQRLHRAPRAPLGGEPERRVDQQDRGDGRGFSRSPMMRDRTVAAISRPTTTLRSWLPRMTSGETLPREAGDWARPLASRAAATASDNPCRLFRARREPRRYRSACHSGRVCVDAPGCGGGGGSRHARCRPATDGPARARRGPGSARA